MSKGKAITSCPRCLAVNERLPVKRRRIHRLPCPVHGEFELHPWNAAAWQMFLNYGPYLLRVDRNSNFKKPIVYAPDLPAIESLLHLHGCVDSEMLDSLLILLEEGLIPIYESGI